MFMKNQFIYLLLEVQCSYEIPKITDFLYPSVLGLWKPGLSSQMQRKSRKFQFLNLMVTRSVK